MFGSISGILHAGADTLLTSLRHKLPTYLVSSGRVINDSNESSSQQVSDLGEITSFGSPNDAAPGCNGHGTLEILEVIRILEAADIPCCLVGVSALKYFGAGLIRLDWEICVLSEMLERASTIFQTDPNKATWELVSCDQHQLNPPYHPLPKFKAKGIDLRFILVPSDKAHIDCDPSNIERSQMGLPYPKLEAFAQSLLETMDRLSLADLIDGMNLTEEWGLEHLDLNGTTHDVEWAQRRNDMIDATNELALGVPEKPFSLREVWTDIVGRKEKRIGPECPKEVYLTRFWTQKQGDPRLEQRDYV